MFTNDIDGGFAIGESSSSALGKVDAIREVIGASQRRKAIVIAIIDQRVAKNEVARNLGLLLGAAAPKCKHRNKQTP